MNIEKLLWVESVWCGTDGNAECFREFLAAELFGHASAVCQLEEISIWEKLVPFYLTNIYGIFLGTTHETKHITQSSFLELTS